MGTVPDQFYFMSLGGLGVSLAGFAGIIATLDKRPSSPVSRWRIRYIVFGGFILAFAGFLAIVVYRSTDENLTGTVRFMSVLLPIVLAVHYRVAQRPGPEWPNERGRRIAMAASWGAVGLWILNVFVGSLALLQGLFLGLLFDPASVFVNAVRDVARGRSPTVDSQPSE